jgi:hypothetical protein
VEKKISCAVGPGGLVTLRVPIKDMSAARRAVLKWEGAGRKFNFKFFTFVVSGVKLPRALIRKQIRKKTKRLKKKKKEEEEEGEEGEEEEEEEEDSAESESDD